MKQPVTFDDVHLDRTLRMAFEDPEAFMVPKGVIRFDYGTTHAWRVNVARDKAKFVEYFFDGQSGSIENGLRRAILYRHEVISAFPVTIEVKSNRALDPSPEKRIARISEPGHLNPYVYWRATWHDSEYRRRTKSYSVVKFGETEARLLALEAATTNHNPIPKCYLMPDAHATEKWKRLLRSEVERVASQNDYSIRRAHLDPAVNDSFPFGYEGERRAVLHMSIERDRALRNKKVSEFLSVHGRLFCQLCDFSFQERYPFLSRDIIEVHHVVPLAQLNSSTRVETSDLMLLCANCHTAIHQGDAAANLEAAKGLFSRLPTHDA